jgi:hypothetical protein
MFVHLFGSWSRPKPNNKTPIIHRLIRHTICTREGVKVWGVGRIELNVHNFCSRRVDIFNCGTANLDAAGAAKVLKAGAVTVQIAAGGGALVVAYERERWLAAGLPTSPPMPGSHLAGDGNHHRKLAPLKAWVTDLSDGIVQDVVIHGVDCEAGQL